jgi:hypothetical protein
MNRSPLSHRSRTGIDTWRGLPALLAATLGLACSGRSADPQKGAEKGAQEATPECVSYERELRACSAAVGAPPIAAETIAATLSRSDDVARLHMEAACARDRVRLRASCK